LWAPALLWQPDVNLELGTVHLAEMTARYPDLVRVLAAYNAGASRVTRWDERAGADDSELFAERIPYRETRDYVRIVQRNRAVYRALYPELAPAALP
jgi:soluble lytic murein transglycosylase